MPVSKLPGHQNSVQLLATSKDRASPDVSSYPKMPGVISGWKFGDLDRQMTEDLDPMHPLLPAQPSSFRTMKSDKIGRPAHTNGFKCLPQPSIQPTVDDREAQRREHPIIYTNSRGLSRDHAQVPMVTQSEAKASTTQNPLDFAKQYLKEQQKITKLNWSEEQKRLEATKDGPQSTVFFTAALAVVAAVTATLARIVKAGVEKQRRTAEVKGIGGTKDGSGDIMDQNVDEWVIVNEFDDDGWEPEQDDWELVSAGGLD